MKSKVVFCAGLVVLFHASQVGAVDLQTMKSVDEAVRLAESIPVVDPSPGARNVGQKIKSVGMDITGGWKVSVKHKSEISAAAGDKIGDVYFTISTSEPSEAFKRQVCDMSGSPRFLKRGGKFYPKTRDANWLMYGDCSTKFPRPD